jgi:hypothetical protein
MSQFVNTQCVNCSKPNRFDLAELRKEDRSISKDILSSRGDKFTEEFIVTCQHCGRGSMSFRVETAYAEGHRGYDEVKGGRSPGEAEPLTSSYPRQRFRKADGGRQPPSAWRTMAAFCLCRDRS